MFENIQSKCKELSDYIASKTGSKLNAYAKCTMLAGEVGELCDEVIALEGDRTEDKNYKNKDELAKEIVDVIYNAINLANNYNIELDVHFVKRLDQIKSKF